MNMFKHHHGDWRLVLSLIILLAGASMPYVNPVTPRLNADLTAFFGLGLFGLVSSFCLPAQKTKFSLNPLSLLSGSWLLIALAQWVGGLSEAYISFFLISISSSFSSHCCRHCCYHHHHHHHHHHIYKHVVQLWRLLL